MSAVYWDRQLLVLVVELVVLIDLGDGSEVAMERLLLGGFVIRVYGKFSRSEDFGFFVLPCLDLVARIFGSGLRT